LIDNTPDLRLVDRSCSRSGSGISSITPDIGRPAVELWRAAPASSLRRASASVVAAAASLTWTTLMIEVPTRMRSPSLRRARPAIFSPLTKVPLVEPTSWIVISASVVVILAWRRDTMSSTSTMSRSLERPMMISRLTRKGNSPPWYFPEMKRSAKRGRSVIDAVWTAGKF
jgi:hypothetical protein